jgi:plasmid stabilization system protein ParE
MNVVFAPLALEDLSDIAEWIAEDNPDRATSFVSEISERCRSLSDFPERFPAIVSIGDHDVRKLTHAGYLVFYGIVGDSVHILRIVHGARDWASLFGA